jgi:hypothetical protein
VRTTMPGRASGNCSHGASIMIDPCRLPLVSPHGTHSNACRQQNYFPRSATRRMMLGMVIVEDLSMLGGGFGRPFRLGDRLVRGTGDGRAE